MATKAERNARARDNQRLSRARRLDYIAALEEKIRQHERNGVNASQEMQISARAVEKQNTMLRSWLLKGLPQIRDSDLHEWLRLPREQADKLFEQSITFSRGDPFIVPPDMPSFLRSSHEFAPPPTSASQSYASESSFSDTPFTPFTPQMHHLDAQYPSASFSMLPGSTSQMHVPQHPRVQSVPNLRHTPYVPTQSPGSRRATVQYSGDPKASLRSKSVSAREYPRSNSIEYTTRYADSRPASLYNDDSSSLQNGGLVSAADHYQDSYQQASVQYPYISNQPLPVEEYHAPIMAANQVSTSSEDLGDLHALCDNANDSFIIECGAQLSQTGQHFCNLLTLLAPATFSPSVSGQNVPRMTCRESYQALQHILGNKMSVEEVVSRLMTSARPTESGDGSYVDADAVHAVLQTIGV